MTVLATASGLPDVSVLRFRRLAYGLFVGDLRLANTGGNVEIPEQTIDDDFQMELAHSADDGLRRLRSPYGP